ncbi:hypothetical protein I3843_07G062500 [Carya illinoinensis]|uniref:phospholipase D delta-like isoform X2 n=1 Tax=Carya illinoinensis TaxID=32201 RepID=UPI001C71EB5E|nr:phospholipase D delta-like isoform X2 [Carya illinoinensis]KAG7970066.1 hypothetical protein I3843_07G062500 [Carya illinoinensis]KAG7970067.1 hypothetical protein I3843_07G062500 [Carya illinoinensis]
MAERRSDQELMTWLHGDLDLTIMEARSLPNMDVVVQNLRRCLTVCDTIKIPEETAINPDGSGGDGDKIHRHRKIIASDPYVKVTVPQVTLARTRVLKNAQDPQWNERFYIPLAHQVVNLEFQVKDDDIFGAEIIGTVKIPALKIQSGELISGWFPIRGASGEPPKPETALKLELKFTPSEKNPLYQHGIAGDPEHKGVRHTYFPLRKGCHVTLYQDAHMPENLLPKIELEQGKPFKQETCWEDICHAITEAHHLIYIVGWSIYHKVKLIREPTRPLPRGGDLTLGELLKYKSEEGVRVLLLVWDDKTSRDKLVIRTPGVMTTHDEETKKFFKNSSVTCVLSPRYASSKMGIIKQQVVGTLFTHHQKCVLVDAQALGTNRKITAFLGGIDLCDGRYDTPEHRLFRDLDTIFHDDFHNPTFAPGTKAPRQPWHDLHSRVEGPAAYDVLINFEQRWRKATRWKEFGLLKKVATQWKDDALIKIERISWIQSPDVSALKNGTTSTYKKKQNGPTSIPKDDPSLWVFSEHDPERWHVQILRSIDSGSVKGLPKTIDAVKAWDGNLICSKNLVIDKSIQTGYIQAIRSAKHFIYIENQYFIGSSYAWPSYENAGADNLIPMELALKIASKIRANERFAVYIVIPMWPEGDPKSSAVQEILYWQSQTMQMMYNVVAMELKATGHVDSHPRDFLNFYCLGNREHIPEERSSGNGVEVSDAQKSKRFMIYVHAKGMIVDDEYVMVGSANINQRSMAGTKDTELAVAAYQPHHTWAGRKKQPRGLWIQNVTMV